MADIRLDVCFVHHPKTKLLQRKLGADAVLALQALWCFAAVERPDGQLTGMNAEYIALAADWDGNGNEFVDTLLALRFLDWADNPDGGCYALHNWAKRNPWVSRAQERSDAAKKAADAGWKKRKGEGMPSAENRNAELCAPHESAYAENESRIEPAMPLTLPILTLPNHTQPNQGAGEGDRRRDASPDQIGDVATVYQNNIGALTAITAEKLAGLTDEYTAAWVLEAITVAVEANARKLSYIEGILKNWHVNGFKASPPNGKSRDRPLKKPEIDNSWMDAYEQAMKPAGEVSA